MTRRRIDLAAIERQRLLDLERQNRARVESQAVASGISETASLMVQRGSEFLIPEQRRGERAKPIRRMTGLEFLISKDRITADQKTEGERYGALYRAASGEVSIRSNLNSSGGGADRSQSLAHQIAAAETRVHAARRLELTRARLSHQPALIDALDTICGRELSPREATRDGHAATALVTLLIVALDLLAAPETRQ